MGIFHMEIVREKILLLMEIKFYNKRCPREVCNHFVCIVKCTGNVLLDALNKLLHNPEPTPERKEAAKGKLDKKSI